MNLQFPVPAPASSTCSTAANDHLPPVHELVAAQADQTPDAVAVRGDRTRLTYRDLEASANRLAHRLRGEGAGPGRRVAVRLPRTPDLVVCLLAVLKTGAAYLPLDPAHPDTRVAGSIREAQAAPLVTAFGTTVPDGVPAVFLDDPHERALLESQPAVAPAVDVDPAELAYLIYTSGSTGRPKGVMVPHYGLSWYTHWAARELDPARGAGAALHSSVAYDLALTSLYPALVSGTAVTVVDGTGVEPLAATFGEKPYGLLKLTPTHLDALAETVPETDLARASHTLVVGGEQLRGEQLRTWTKLAPDTVVVNSYGPTETTVACCAHVARAGDLAGGTVPIGRAIAGAALRVLDENLEPVPHGEAGELYVAGPGVVRGYVADPALTASRFLPDPFGPPGGRMYRTGDTVRRLVDGELEFLHRADRQVKVDGHRIEPAEVEQAAREHPDVLAAVATVGDHHGRTALALHLAGADADPRSVRAHLAGRLPRAAVPSLWTVLTELPLLANGKVDRAALPAPSPLATVSDPPRGPTEELVARIWCDLLGTGSAGREEGFVELGGRSLLAARAATRLYQETGARVTAGDVLSARTVAGLAALLETRGHGEAPEPLVPSSETGPAPLSAAQRGLWFLDQLHPGGIEYLVPTVLRLVGPLDTEALSRAFTALVTRHEVLRTRYVTDSTGDPVQVVDPPFPLSVTAEHSDPERIVAEELSRPIDLATGPVMRVRLVRVGAEDHRLVLVLHHVATDGWSMGLLAGELAERYADPSGPVPEPPHVQYGDYARWQRDALAGPGAERDLAYWSEYLSGLEETELPTDRPRAAVRDTAGDSYRFTVPAELVERLTSLGAARGATPFATCLAGWYALAHRRTGGTDLTVGVPVSGRSVPGTENLIGFCANTVVLRADLSGRPSFETLIDQVAQVSARANTHEALPFDRVVEALAPERDAARTPLFQVMFAFQAAGTERFALPGLRVAPEEVAARAARFDLTLELTPGPDGSLRGHLVYSTALFDRATIRTLADQYLRLLARAADSPGARLQQLELLPASERRALVDGARGPVRPRSPEGLPELIAAQVERTPQAVAVDGAGGQLTYTELDRAANGLAHGLRERGVRSGDVVGVCHHRGPGLVVSLLGIQRAGAAYLPLDPAHPTERLAYMVADAGARLVVTDSGSHSALPEVPRLLVDRESIGSRDAAPVGTDPDAPAYVVHTSGSTGHPKGVIVPHRGIGNRVLWAVEQFGLDARDRFLQKTSVTFDAMAWEIFAPLVSGGTVVMAEPGAESDPTAVAEALRQERITILQGVPSFLRLVAEESGLAECTALRLVFSAGEPLPAAMADRLHSASGAAVVNTYGPTECSIDVTFHEYRGGGEGGVPIGRALDNTSVLVLDSGTEPVPPGVRGELYAAGEGLAHGYTGQPRLTAERFVPDPHGPPGGRMYRTGDVVRRASDGDLEYLGRSDDQVKIRGVRVEPGEVEAVLDSHPGVAATAVVARPGPEGQARLVAHTVPAGEGGADEAGLRTWVADRLPGPWNPSVYVWHDRLPTTASGKLDRAALPAPASEDSTADSASQGPRTRMEETVAQVWREVLEVHRVGAEDDFFDLGGHSLLATRITSRLGADLGVRVPVRALFDDRTVSALAARLEGSVLAGAAPTDRIPDPVQEHTGPAPLSPAQERMWFLHTLRPDSTEYNVTWAVSIDGPLDVRALEHALGDVVRRHTILRTRYPTGPGGVAEQVVEQYRPLRLPVRDLGERSLDEEITVLAGQAFDLAAAPPFAPHLFNVAGGQHALVVALHHIACDAWSEEILARDLATAYTARAQGTAPAFAPLPLDHAGHALRQVRRAQEDAHGQDLAYWRERLTGLRPLDLLTDRPRSPVRDTSGAVIELSVAPETAAAVDTAGRAHGATPFMTHLALFAVLLARYTGGTDVAVGTPVAGRDDVDTENLIGLFVNTLLMRVDTDGATTFGDLVRRVRGIALEAYDHSGLAFERLVEELAPERDQSRNPLFDIMFETREVPARDTPELPGLQIRRVAAGRTTAKFDLTFALEAEPDGGYRISIEYATALFDAATVRRLGRHYVRLAESVAADPATPVRDLDMLDASERNRALAAWSGESVQLQRETVHGAFRAQAERTPDTVAVDWAHGCLTYAELAERVDTLAACLTREGVAEESPVGVYLDRSPDAVVVLLAVLKAGGTYVPLDTGHPGQRTEFMLRDLAAPVVVAHEGYADRVTGMGPTVVAVSAGVPTDTARPPEPDRANASVVAPSEHADPDRLAYAIYTSGSTGRPKGVMVDHRAYTHHCRTIAEAYGIRPGDRVVLLSSLTFDVAMDQIAAPLLLGGTVVVAPPGFTPPEKLPDLLARHRITHMEITPAYYREMMYHVAHGDRRLAELRLIVVSSDVVTVDDARRWAQAGLPGRFLPTYGPTEATVTCMAHALGDGPHGGARAETALPVGAPIRGTRTYVLDTSMRPVPAGVPGELCVGGDRLARGYLGRPVATAQRFVPDPFGGPGQRLYRTGDLARYREDGVVEFLGRIDTQVKIRGFRIELGEVEAALNGHPAVRAAAVTAPVVAGERRLVGHVVARDPADYPVPVLREHLLERLPGYMVPELWTALDALPLTPSKKVDRRSLPVPDPADLRPETEYVAPRDEIEQAVADVWEEVLDRDGCGVEDDFFLSGGHSILATRVMVRLRDLTGLDVPLRLFFDATTIAEQAAALARFAEAEVDHSDHERSR